jgi:hypothetical protein
MPLLTLFSAGQSPRFCTEKGYFSKSSTNTENTFEQDKQKLFTARAPSFLLYPSREYEACVGISPEKTEINSQPLSQLCEAGISHFSLHQELTCCY